MPLTPTPRMIPTAEPFFFPGGPTGCLLIHGFTGTPKEMLWMGEYLAQHGHTVLGMRLAGHATQPADLLRTRWTDWLVSVEAGYHLLHSYLNSQNKASDQTPSIYAMGLSMGGVLALILASEAYQSSYPLAGVVGISTPYSLRQDWRMRYLKVLRFLAPNVAKGKPDWHNAEAGKDHIDYPAYPTQAVAELRDLLKVMGGVLPAVHIPTLLIHSKEDRGVLPENMPLIFERLGSPEKEMLWVENSGHVVVREPPRQQVFERILEFIGSTNLP